MKTSSCRAQGTRAAFFFSILLLLLLVGCGGGGDKHAGSLASGASTTTATRGKGAVSFTIRWPAASTTRLIPTASKAIKFSVVEYEAPNNVVVLEKVVARPPDTEATSTVVLDGLPTVLVNITANAFPKSDATGVVQASGTLTVGIEQNKTIDKTITLDSTVKTVEVTAAAPVTIGTDGKFTLNLSDQTTVGSVKAALTATAYNAAHEVVLTALNKWVYKSANPAAAMVSDPSASRAVRGKTRAEGIGGAQADVTAVGDGDSVITVTESESQIGTQVTASVVGGKSLYWNQQFGDAQNSSCSSGPSVQGATASLIPLNGAVILSRPFIEAPNGNLSFIGVGFFGGGIVDTYDKTGALVEQISSANDPVPSFAQSIAYGADGTLYIRFYDSSGTSGRVEARGASSWSYAFSGADDQSPLTLSGDSATLYAVLGNALVALDAHSGNTKWSVPCNLSNVFSGRVPKPAVSLDNQTVYAFTDGGLAAFNAQTGAPLWVSSTGASSLSENDAILVAPTGTVYGFANGTFRALNPSTGAVLWQRPSNSIYGPFTVSRNNKILVHLNYDAGLEYGVGALDGATGNVAWKRKDVELASSERSVGTSDGTFYVYKYPGNDGPYAPPTLLALDANNGFTKREISFGKGVRGAIAGSADGTIYATADNDEGGLTVFTIK